MTSRAIPIDSAELLGCINESGAFDPRGSRVVIEFTDGRDEGCPQVCAFALTRDEAERLAREIMIET